MAKKISKKPPGVYLFSDFFENLSFIKSKAKRWEVIEAVYNYYCKDIKPANLNRSQRIIFNTAEKFLEKNRARWTSYANDYKHSGEAKKAKSVEKPSEIGAKNELKTEQKVANNLIKSDKNCLKNNEKTTSENLHIDNILINSNSNNVTTSNTISNNKKEKEIKEKEKTETSNCVRVRKTKENLDFFNDEKSADINLKIATSDAKSCLNADDFLIEGSVDLGNDFEAGAIKESCLRFNVEAKETGSFLPNTSASSDELVLIETKASEEPCVSLATSGYDESVFKPPTLQEVEDYIMQNDYIIDPTEFFLFYKSKGWKVGNVVMTDWRAKVDQWENKRKPAYNNGFYTSSGRKYSKKSLQELGLM